MVSSDHFPMSGVASLSVIAVILALTVAASLLFPRRAATSTSA
jgi:hypothetical protein